MKKKRKHLTIAPLLLTRESRQVFYLNLPPEVSYGLKQIARSEGKSGSWVVEQILCEWSGIRPDYKERGKSWQEIEEGTRTRDTSRSTASGKRKRRRPGKGRA